MAELLFTSMGSKGKFKSIGKSKYKAVLEGVDSSLVWFTDRPDRDAGKVSFSDLISQWNDGFKGVNPNSALVFKDQNGVEDTVVFEQTRPKYNSRKNKLTFNLKVHNKQKLDLVSGALSDEARDADGVFTKKFSDFSLFIDNWFSKDTSVNFVNGTNEPMRLVRLKYSTAPDFKQITEAALKAGVLWNYGYEQKEIDVDDPNFNIWLNEKQAKTVFKETAKVNIINSAVSVATDLIFPATKLTPSLNQDDIIYIQPGESRRITDVDTKFGFSDVRDIGVIAGRFRQNPTNFSMLAFDNPTVGSPKGYVKPLAVDFGKAVTSTENIFDSGDTKTSTYDLLNQVDQVKFEYMGDKDIEGTDVKAWEVTFQNFEAKF